jgi:hypothetical protein
VPLRPLSLGDLYDGAFRAIRHNPKVMLGLPALLSLVSVVVTALFGVAAWSQLGWLFDDLRTFDDDPVNGTFVGPTASTVVGLSLIALIVVVVSVLVTVVTQGVIIANIGQAVLGRRPTPGEVWAAVRGRLGGLVLISLFESLVPAVSLVVLVGVVAVVAQASTGAAVVVGVLGGLALAVAWVWFVVRVVLSAPTYVLERGTVRGSIARAWRLTRGAFWRVLGIGLLTVVIGSVLSSILQVPGSIVSEIIGFSSASSGSPSGGGVVAAFVVGAVFGIIAATITTAFTGGVTALLYVDLRMRREGLDVALAAAAAKPAPTAGR